MNKSRNRRYCPRERFSYLQQLVTEFQDTNSEAVKEQVLANLANFAYDPINFEYIRRLNVISLFLDQLDSISDKLVEFAVGGLCNLALDRTNKEIILNHGGVDKIIKCLSSPKEETVLSAITTLMFLVTPQSKKDITSLPVIDCMLRFSEAPARRLSNLATVFLEDYCTAQQVAAAKEASAVPPTSE
ncbi:armadillo repeat-containing protein 7-like isoform X2 [Limulus polyphemus]|uniref:Armadillo repeat-containing protein 7-like isoform X2 n=1 Tax=Limulus polyphemus TaxID=6850 RepID=A0ABM1B2N0_LIMPO|nr:armadillo repeat-containing protein 7-like isoform X2 [Limulus polyphemus]